MSKEEKVFTKEKFLEEIEIFRKQDKINKTMLSLDWMDNYVAKVCPEKIEEYIKACAKIKKRPDKNGEMRKDVSGVRDFFIETFLPDLTDDAIKARKEAKKAAKEAEKEEKKRFAELPLEDQLRAKLESLKDK